MRGGSTVFGEIFNQNPEAAYWYESVDGAFAALYGLEYGIRTHEITHHNNRTYRYYKVCLTLNALPEVNFHLQGQYYEKAVDQD